MGTGKTIQSIALAYLYWNDWPLLIIVPSFLWFSWRDEILRWLDSIIVPDDI